ncbi:MAG: type I secretion protein [Pseudomonadota bacterium]
MSLTQPEVVFGSQATAGLFGGNILADRGELLGNSYDAAVDDLGITTLRFPGGSLTEYLFDIRFPDAPTAFDVRFDEVKQMIGLSEFMSYAEQQGAPVTIVIPTQTQLSDAVDAGGNRLPDIQEGALRQFVQDVAGGRYGDVEVRAFEVGNEYWGSGQMNAAEYGRLAAEMSMIVDDALAEIGMQDVDVLVQKGQNFSFSELSAEYEGVSTPDALADINARFGLDLGGEAVFGSGRINWTHVNNEIILNEFDTEAERAAIDGVIAHVYSRGADAPNTRVFDLNNINETWRAEMPELDVYVTEWNLKSTSNLDLNSDYGLFQAHEMLNMVEVFMRLDVTEANVWPLIQNTSNALSNGFTYTDATIGGEMFAMMAETLPGKVLLDFAPAEARVTEAAVGDVAVHAFAGEQELALYLVNTQREDSTMTDVDISGLIETFGAADVTLLGVAAGDAPGSNRSSAEVRELAAGQVIQDGFISADLMPGEIMQVVFNDVTPTEDFQPIWQTANDPARRDAPREDTRDVAPADPNDPGDDGSIIPTVPVTDRPVPEDEPEEDDPLGLVATGADLGLGMAVLPLLLLLGLAAF